MQYFKSPDELTVKNLTELIYMSYVFLEKGPSFSDMMGPLFKHKILDSIVYEGITSPKKYNFLISARCKLPDWEQFFVFTIASFTNCNFPNSEFLKDAIACSVYGFSYINDALIASYISAIAIMSDENYKNWYFQNDMKKMGALDKSIDSDPESDVMRCNVKNFLKEIDDKTWRRLTSISI